MHRGKCCTIYSLIPIPIVFIDSLFIRATGKQVAYRDVTDNAIPFFLLSNLSFRDIRICIYRHRLTQTNCIHLMSPCLSFESLPFWVTPHSTACTVVLQDGSSSMNKSDICPFIHAIALAKLLIGGRLSITFTTFHVFYIPVLRITMAPASIASSINEWTALSHSQTNFWTSSRQSA